MLTPLDFLATPGEIQGKQLLLQMFFIWILGVIIFIVGFAQEQNRGKGFWIKWLAIIPFLGALLMGFNYWNYARDPFNIAAGSIGGNSQNMYMISPWLALVALLVFVVTCVLVDKRRKARAEIY
jgi:hypothetical protein